LAPTTKISATAQVIIQVANARQRVRVSSQIATAIRRGIVTTPLPRTLRARARAVRGALRMSSIACEIARSQWPRKGSVVRGAVVGACRPTATKTKIVAPRRANAHANARR
jgi:hypothetical protein